MIGNNIPVTQEKERLDMVLLNKDFSASLNLLTWQFNFMKIIHVCCKHEISQKTFSDQFDLLMVGQIYPQCKWRRTTHK